MRKYLYLLCALLLTSRFTNAQQQHIRCATAELHQTLMQTDSAYHAHYQNIGEKIHAYIKRSTEERTSATSSIITIPVVIHILESPGEATITDAQVQSQIQVLNEDYTGTNANRSIVPAPWQGRFGNAGFNFCLATRTPGGDWTTGIERKQTTTDSFNYGDQGIKSSASGGLDAWDASRYLNIWVCNLYGGLLGYTQLPGGPASTDGCVVKDSSFGRGYSWLFPEYNLGRTATHEVGHWFGLFHVWGDDNGACYGSDYIDDTPNQSDATYNCPSFPDIDGCAHDTDDTGIPGDPVNGILYMDYMDYSYDECMSMFTVDQVAEMHFVIDSIRTTILTSNGCAAPTGIANINAETFIDLYPNPTTSLLHINVLLPSTTILNVTAYDMLGKKLISSDINKTGQQNIDMDVSSLSGGLYLLILNTDQGTIAKRFSITR